MVGSGGKWKWKTGDIGTVRVVATVDHAQQVAALLRGETVLISVEFNHIGAVKRPTLIVVADVREGPIWLIDPRVWPILVDDIACSRCVLVGHGMADLMLKLGARQYTNVDDMYRWMINRATIGVEGRPRIQCLQVANQLISGSKTVSELVDTPAWRQSWQLMEVHDGRMIVEFDRLDSCQIRGVLASNNSAWLKTAAIKMAATRALYTILQPRLTEFWIQSETITDVAYTILRHRGCPIDRQVAESLAHTTISRPQIKAGHVYPTLTRIGTIGGESTCDSPAAHRYIDTRPNSRYRPIFGAKPGNIILSARPTNLKYRAEIALLIDDHTGVDSTTDPDNMGLGRYERTLATGDGPLKRRKEIVDEATDSGVVRLPVGWPAVLGGFEPRRELQARAAPDVLIAGTAAFIFRAAVAKLAVKGYWPYVMHIVRDEIIFEIPETNITDLVDEFREALHLFDTPKRSYTGSTGMDYPVDIFNHDHALGERLPWAKL